MMRTIALLLIVITARLAAADPAADALAAESAAYEKAKPVFEKFCASCHTKDGAKATPKKLDHFDMTSYPFGGHHAGTLGPTIRKQLGIGGGKAKMPSDKPGSVRGDDLKLIEAWSRAWDAAQAAGAHAPPPDHDHHHHD